MKIKRLANKLLDLGDKLSPVTETECLEVESDIGYRFPKTYREFLLSMGRGAGRFMSGSSAFYNELPELRQWAEELLQENNFSLMPRDAFVFWMHQGYQLAFFRSNGGDDPPVYYYSEGNNQEEFEVYSTVSEFFQIQAKISGIYLE